MKNGMLNVALEMLSDRHEAKVTPALLTAFDEEDGNALHIEKLACRRVDFVIQTTGEFSHGVPCGEIENQA